MKENHYYQATNIKELDKLLNQFYKTFQIKGNFKYVCKCGTSSTPHTVYDCNSPICDKIECDQRINGYFFPPIKDEVYLELINLLIEIRGYMLFDTCNNIKISILKECVKIIHALSEEKAQMFRQRVQELIEESNKIW